MLLSLPAVPLHQNRGPENEPENGSELFFGTVTSFLFVFRSLTMRGRKHCTTSFQACQSWLRRWS